MKPGGTTYSPEFELVLACLRWPQENVDGDRIQSLARQPIRWPYLLEIVHHHKVVPLFSRNLESFAPGYMPDEPAAALRASAAANRETCLRRIGHLLLLNRLFRHGQVEYRVFKGIPLAITAFDDPSLRDAGDIDLLVAEKDVFTASDILRSEGYVRFEPPARLTERRLRSYMAHQKDFSYQHPGAGMVIDLHWRLFRNPFLPANAGLAEVGEHFVSLGSESIPTLPTPQLLLYLCVHGALDGWLRLKWLADIAALLRTMTAEQLASTAAAAAQQQALPQLSAASLLCNDLLGSCPQPPGCLDRNDRTVAHILRFSKRLMTSNQCRPIREQVSSTQWLLNEARLYTTLDYRLNLLERSLFRPRAWRRFDLPDALFPLYALLSPLDSLSFHLSHRLATLKNAVLPEPSSTHIGRAQTISRYDFPPLDAFGAWRRRPGSGSGFHAHLLSHCTQVSAGATAHGVDGQGCCGPAGCANECHADHPPGRVVDRRGGALRSFDICLLSALPGRLLHASPAAYCEQTFLWRGARGGSA